MEKINASRFKQECLAILDNLKPEGILVTKHGKPVARVIPATSDCSELIGSLKGKLKIKGNILSTGARWNAQS
jgi:prevent-host-death family protein